MRRKLGTHEVLALLAAAGVSTCAAAQAAKVEDNTKSNAQSLQVTGQPARANLGSKEMACGKGSCGTDEKGAKAAAEKHHEKKQAKHTEKKVVEHKEVKKVEEKKK
jgi:hypothetical protein